MSFVRKTYRDFASDEDGDIKIVNGDLAIEISDQAHIDDILTSAKGNWRESPLTGVEIHRFLNTPQQIGRRGELFRKIRMQLEFDNFRVDQLKLSGDVLSTGKQGLEIAATRLK